MSYVYEPKKVRFNPYVKTVPQNPNDPPFIPPLRLAVTTRPFSIPPDPGDAGKITLEGIDSDQDGLRDDLQREIFFAYPGSERARRALGDMYKVDIKWLGYANDPIGLRTLTHVRNKRGLCLEEIKSEIGLPPSKKFALIDDFLLQVLYNTTLRKTQLTKAGNNTSGSVIISPEESSLGNCLFNPKSLSD